MVRVLYIVYWGALEPLGQSLVLPAVMKLAQDEIDLTLVTFEKPEDLANITEAERVRRIFLEHNITWIPLKYHKTPKIPATLFDISAGVANGLRKRLRKRFDIVHGRTFIGGLISLIFSRLSGAKFIYHTEGFYPEEQVDCGVWTTEARAFKAAKKLDDAMYARADGIIALSDKARRIIESKPEISRRGAPVIVVPSCVDLERFKISEGKPNFSGVVKLAYIGSVGGRYLLDKIGRFTAAAKTVNSNVELQIYSRTSRELIAETLSKSGLSNESWQLAALAYREVPDFLSRHHAGFSFLENGLSDGGSPTKVGEYWALGLPVITTPDIGDTEDIIRREKVGVIVEAHDDEAYLKAFRELKLLLADSELSSRCRQAAEKHYNLDTACKDQKDLYKRLSGK